jgi:hypothetical protein
MNYIKPLSILLTFFGVFLSFIGLIPYVVHFPTSDPTASGPRNLWEVLIYFAYDGEGWYLPIGIIMLVMGLLVIYRIIK